MSSTTTILRRFSAVHSIGSGYRLRRRTIYGSFVTQRQPDPPNHISHSAENYFVDGDETPPPENSVYKVDPASDAAQSAYEPPSEPWSQTEAGMVGCQTVSKDKQYDVPNDPNVKPRERMDEGDKVPEGSERDGRKPEERA